MTFFIAPILSYLIVFTLFKSWDFLYLTIANINVSVNYIYVIVFSLIYTLIYIMLSKKIKYIYDFIDSKDCFESVDIAGGICYFLIENRFIKNLQIKI